jgi:hypothetical protein
VFDFKNIAEAKPKYYYKGPHRPNDAKSSATAHGAGSQVSSQSSGSPPGHTHLPQQSSYSGISAHKLNPQARPEQLKLSKADLSTWPYIANS